MSIQLEIWLALLRQGGRWRPKELRESLPDECEAPQYISSVLQSMARTGQVRAFPMPGKTKAFEYGVTARCSAPKGLTIGALGDVVKLVQEPAP